MMGHLDHDPLPPLYMVHRVYTCSNMKSPFVMKQYDQLEGYVKANHVTSSFTCPSLHVLQ